MLGQVDRITIFQKLIYYTVMTLLAFIVIYPFVFMLTTSLKDSPEVFADIMKPFGEALRFDNYKVVLSTVKMGRYMFNTLIVTIGVVVGQIITSMMGGYAFSRINFPGRDILFRIYLGTIMIPFVVIMIPIYKMMMTFNWLDKFQSLIIPWIFTAAGTFLFRQFFKSIPKDLEEAAVIDGASRWTILWRIFFPLSIPAVATQATISFLYAWNSFIWPLVAIQTKDHYVVTQGLADIQGGYHASPPIIMAGATLVILPTVLVFLLAQRYFVEGVATTGMKN